MTYVNGLLLKAMTGVQSLAHRLRDERGQDLLEYAMLGGLIVLGILGIVVLLTAALTGMFTGIGNCIDFDSATVCSKPF